ncbi:MAG: TrkH family potassium uptake protein [Oscillospiraceae bacterium]|nr:TrkH family potassium uptake protein [Oscillospiraceae bacterium]
MNIKIVGNYVGKALIIEAAFMLPALIIALSLGETSSAFAFLYTIIAAAAVGVLFISLKSKEEMVYSREGFVIVSITWIVLSLVGAIPFCISKAIPNYLNSVFETVSGFTTTGASILNNVEILPKSILYWRSFTNWLGGMGVIMFLLAIVPDIKDSGTIRMMKAESPGPVVGKLVPKLKRTAIILYEIYIALTLLETILLLAGGVPFFDSLCIALSNAGTGGFSIKNASIGFYNDYVQIVVGIFMLLFGVNFNVFYLILLKRFKQAIRSEEFRVYCGIVIFSTALITINTMNLFANIGEGLKHSFFQVATIISTTGFATTDFNLWPEFSKCLMVLLMLIGACAGSTAGGTKIARTLILIKSFKNTIQKLIHPRSVKIIKIDGEKTEENSVKEVHAYFTAYVLIFAVSILAVSFDNFGFDTTITSVAATLNNIGPGLGAIGPTGNYAGFSAFSKIVLILDMLIGRLEIFPVLMLAAPSIWKRQK